METEAAMETQAVPNVHGMTALHAAERMGHTANINQNSFWLIFVF